MGPFTPDELPRVQAALRRRFVNPRYPQVASIGMGVALKGGRPDASRGLAVTVYVTRKLKRPAKSARLPTSVRVRVKRAGRYVSATLPTDVVDVGRVRPTGVRLTPVPPAKPGTGGVWLEWSVDGAPGPQAGLLTVGHIFPPASGLTAQGQVVHVGDAGAGVYIDKADVPDAAVDAAIVALWDAAPVVSQAGGVNSTTPPVMPWDAVLVATNEHRKGRSLTSAGSRRFTLQAYSALFDLPTVGQLRDVVRVTSPTVNAFKEGTSGSAWVVADALGNEILALIQVAADPGTDKKYLTGYGQILAGNAAITRRGPVDWATDRIEFESGVVVGSVQVRGHV